MSARIVFYITLVSLGIGRCFSQDTSITRQQMYEDFDYLVATINKTNPYLEVKKTYFNYSIIDTINSFRSEIANCYAFNDFHLLTMKVMNTCIDGHSAVITSAKWPETNLFIPLVYRQGEYFISKPFTYKGNKFEVGSKLVAINGNRNIHEEVSRQVPNRYMMRWDNRLNVFYSEVFFWSNSYIQKGEIQLEFSAKDEVSSTLFTMSEKISLESEVLELNDLERVEYFEENKILYIRVPSMNWNTRNYYKKVIPQVAKGREIVKVVIDVRYNNGGSSIVGRNIFRSILPTPISFRTRLAGISSTSFSKKYGRQHNFERKIEIDTIKELSNLPMYRYVDKIETIKPFKKSIEHTGEIYIVGNEHVYSAGGAIFMFSNHSKTDRIFSIGTPTGWFLGEFSDPIQFELPNSKLEFIISPSLSLTNVNGWENSMLDSYDHEITPEFEYYLERNFTEEYLIERDPYFEPILKHK